MRILRRSRVVASIATAATALGLGAAASSATAHVPVCSVNAQGGRVACHTGITDPRMFVTSQNNPGGWIFMVYAVNPSQGLAQFIGSWANTTPHIWTRSSGYTTISVNNCNNVTSIMNCDSTSGTNNTGTYGTGHLNP